MKKTVFIMALVLSILEVSAQTYVSGGIYVNTTWTKASSPYIVTDTVFVFPGVVLTIEPGVSVRFNNNKALEIREGSLIAEGSAIDSITFTSNATTPTEGSWAHIYFLNGALDSKLKYCNFKYAQKGIQIGSLATIFINRCSFEKNEIGIGEVMYSHPGGSLRIDSTNFGYNKYYGILLVSANTRLYFNQLYVHHNSIGIVGSNQSSSEPDPTKRDWYIKNSIIDSNYEIGLNVRDHLKVLNCHIGYNKIGYIGDNNTIKNCVFEYNTDIGFKCGSYDSLINCKVHHSKDGIFTRRNGFYFEGNEITHNDIGINAENASMAFIFGNIVSHNRIGISKLPESVIVKYNTIEKDSIGIQATEIINNISCNKFCNNWIYDLEYKGKSNVHVGNNYWCTIDSAIVVSKIFDGYDDPSYGLAKFMPIDTSCYKALGIKELKRHQQAITILYPNPFNNTATLAFENPQNNNHHLGIFNTMGQLVLSIDNIKGNKVLIDRKELQTGLYFYQLQNEDGVIGSGKMMIE